MVTSLIERFAISASQKAGAIVATKIATTIATTYAICLFQNQVIKNDSEKLQKRADEANKNGEILSQEEISKAQQESFGKIAVGSGILTGANLVASNGIANIIKGL